MLSSFNKLTATLARLLLAITLGVILTIGTLTSSMQSALADTGNYPYYNTPCVHSPYATTGSGYWCYNYDWGTIRDNTSNTSELSPYGYYYRNCVDYVAWKLSTLGVQPAQYKGLGNANQWPTTAPSHGLPVDSTPAAGAAAVSTGGTYGHVAFIEAYNASTGQLTVSEYNKNQDGNYGTRTGSLAGLGFDRVVHFEQYETNYSPSSGGTTASPGTGVGSASFLRKDQLGSDEKIYPNQYIMSSDNRFVLILQTDGNLVIYGPGFQPIWSTGTSGKSVAFAAAQSDGNFVLYGTGTSGALWSSNTSGAMNSVLVQPDGNLVVYTTSGGVWSTKTAGQV